MSYNKHALFIDTNIYLEFYEYSKSDLNSLEKLSDSLKKEHFELLVNQQLKDEFINNRAARVSKAFEDYKKLGYNHAIPTLFNNQIQDVQRLHQAKKEYEKIYRELLNKIQKDVLNETLKADLIIKNIFELAEDIKCDDKIYKKAMQRMRYHNPPGKPGKIGDAIHWESLLSHIKKGKTLTIISNDSDFIDDLYILTKQAHSFLKKEWNNKKNAELFFYKDLTSFLQENLPKFELHDEFKEKITELISDLSGSQTFLKTHEVINELEQYFDHLEPSHIINVIECYEYNNQINWIIDDPDIDCFLKKIRELPELPENLQSRIDALFQNFSEQ